MIHIICILFDCSNLGLLHIIDGKTYGNETLNRSNVFRWHSRFQGRSELVEDDERGGRPKSTRTEVNMAATLFTVNIQYTSSTQQYDIFT
jgi:hypothetical protein